ncbi:MAG: hypothetical protein V1909_02300 [Candidatus Micrarchaeota archaeon]
MDIQELRGPLGRLTPWRLTVGLSMCALLTVLLLELAYKTEGPSLYALEYIELSALLVLFVDLAVNFSRAGNKMKFVRKNWFELFLFVPFAFTFRALRAFELFEVMGFEAMPFLMRTHVIVRGGHFATHASRSELARLARKACSELLNAPDRYRTMKYRGLLSFS